MLTEISSSQFDRQKHLKRSYQSNDIVLIFWNNIYMQLKITLQHIQYPISFSKKNWQIIIFSELILSKLFKIIHEKYFKFKEISNIFGCPNVIRILNSIYLNFVAPCHSPKIINSVWHRSLRSNVSHSVLIILLKDK